MIAPSRPFPITEPEPSGPIPDEVAELIAALLLEIIDHQET